MNYGTHESERRLKALQLKTSEVHSKLFFKLVFKAFFVLFLFLAVPATARNRNNTKKALKMLKNSFEVYLADFDWRALSLRSDSCVP